MIRHLIRWFLLLAIAAPVVPATAQILVAAEQPGPDCGG